MLWLAVVAFAVVGAIGWHAYAHAFISQDVATSISNPPESRAPEKAPDSGAQASGSRSSSDLQAQRIAGLDQLSLTLSERLSPTQISQSQDTRTGLTRNQFEPEGYRFYTYLLFGDESDVGRNRRLVAAKAHCKIVPISDPHIEKQIEQGNQYRFNLLSVPLKVAIPPEVHPDPERCAEFVVQNYDYDRARDLIDRARLPTNGMYLLGYKERLFRDVAFDREQVLIVDLSVVNEDLIELSVIEFRRLARKAHYSEWDVQHFFYNLRIALSFAGDLVRIGTAAAKELTK